MKSADPWDQYGHYLQLEKILGAQTPWSAPTPAHDETLFIVFHQIYELWFKQVLFELDDVRSRFTGPVVNDRDLQPILSRLERIAAIFRLLVRQIDVLETMTPQDYTDFRGHLKTASGFQSWQFRLIEAKMGLRREDRLKVFHKDFDDSLDPGKKSQIKAAEDNSSLHDLLDLWLARTPFIDSGDYQFWTAYRAAVHDMLDQKEKHAAGFFAGEALAAEQALIAKGRAKFDAIFDPARHKDGPWRLSWRALQAALFITVYRQEPVLQIPARMLSLIMDIDETLALWRYRHALMAQRMTGMNAGTGGSSGYGYLIDTLEKHRIFTDLFALSTYLIPAHSLPDLPERISADMGYRYGT